MNIPGWSWLNSLRRAYHGILHIVIDIKIRSAASIRPLRVILGADDGFQEGWVSTDITHLNILLVNDWRRYFRENSIDALLAEHVLEHLTESDAIIALRNCHHFLKPGGYLRVAVPDGLHPSREYLDAVKPMGSGFGSEDHKVLFTYLSLSRLMKTAGFKVELLEYFDEQGAFHCKEWDPGAGMVTRSMRFDARNIDGDLNYTSVILDAWKCAEWH